MASPASNKNPLPSCQIEQEQRQIETPPRDRGGYDCEFVERPKELETDCPICLQVLRDPFQTSCCGNTFCQSCIKRVQDDEKACPTCNEVGFGVFPDKRLRRSLYPFQVRCVHQKSGCEWTGELGELDRHLNLNPKLGKQLVGCAFATVACTHCCEYFQRRHVHVHETESCPQRPFSCDYCEDYGSVYEDIVNNHWPVCKCYPVPCPNECGVSPERQNVETHENTVCPLTVVNCDFHYAGCEVQLVRKDMPTHLAESLATHISLLTTQTQTLAGRGGQDNILPYLSLLALHNQQLTQLTIQQKASMEKLERENEALKRKMNQEVARELAELKLKIQALEKGKQVQAAESKQEIAALTLKVNNDLEQEVAELRRQRDEDKALLVLLQHQYVPVFPIELVITNFALKKSSNSVWYSLPFYTHPQGYKMCLKVDANGNGDGKGTHVSVYTHLMRGEFDDCLKWPFQGCVVLQLCNQLEDKRHRGHTISFSETENLRAISRVTDGERAESGWGTSTLIAHNDLNFNPANNCQFLKHDHLCFRVITVASLSEPGILPTELTMINFEQHKTNRDDWYSPPFYTHPQGYKMCLTVYANGKGDGKGTHVSVYACLMRGEFDDHLKWPFQGRVVLQLCNQLEDKRHRGHTIGFSEAKAINRVTDGKWAKSGWGTSTLIAHKDLNFNPANKCQYLKHDHLRFRVITVESLSEPGILPTERTMTNFEQHKTDRDNWYSPPFYTHPQGYKMCLCVYANGKGDGKGTHVSVYTCLMRGEFDDRLKWPFQGRVVLQLCNQLEDKRHRGHTISFSEAKAISRVTDGERAESGWGISTLIAHKDLNFNPANNCQFLDHDHLCFRVITVESLSEPGILPTELTMTDFEQHKTDRDDWYSSPFYTHPQGYKMCLNVYANGEGDGEGTHVSVYAFLMRGEFDDHLKWPFRGCVVLQLCNQLEDKRHRGHTISFSETADPKVISRVTDGERAESGWGTSTLIAHNDLNFNPANNCQYLKHDHLHFRVITVESLSEPGILPTERTMTNFEQHKTDRDDWYSPPFYTHPQGYKMCLNVYASRNGRGKGTHVSVYARLMRGEFDDHLKWPFQGRVVLQLCNQLEDKRHCGRTFSFSKTADPKVISRVTDGERAESGLGTSTLIAHNDLNFNPANNYQYLEHDHLRFRVITVESLSEPGVLPTELTMINFEQHKIDSDWWYSPPFYTQQRGYKMCLSVVANGNGKGKGIHVSVYAYLLRGEFDDHLKWPFQSQVTVAMLNQLEDNNHTTKTIKFAETTNIKIIGRVTDRERAPTGYGEPTFIAHTDLTYTPAKNRQYLKYDCLRFRIINKS